MSGRKTGGARAPPAPPLATALLYGRSTSRKNQKEASRETGQNDSAVRKRERALPVFVTSLQKSHPRLAIFSTFGHSWLFLHANFPVRDVRTVETSSQVWACLTLLTDSNETSAC